MLSSIDYGVTVFYAVALILIAWRVSRKTSGEEINSNDYFLAGQNLPWWAIGASLIAANISAEQIIGMSGSGYVLEASFRQSLEIRYGDILVAGLRFRQLDLHSVARRLKH